MSDSLHKFERFGWGLRVAGGSAPVAEDDDLGAEMLAAEVEAGENPAHEPDAANDAGAAGASASDGLGDAPAGVADVAADGGDVLYPGIAIQPPDEIFALRDYVRARISEAKLIRLDAATDPTRWQTLNTYESQYNNLWRLKHELHGEAIVIPAEVMQGHEEYLLAFARRSAIESHALDLERRAATAEKATLDLMAADIWSGGP